MINSSPVMSASGQKAHVPKRDPAFAHKHPGPRLIGSLRSWRFALGASFFERHRRASGVLALHSITSSARTRTEGGMAMPRVFALFRLITSSITVGCSIGSSTALAPFKMRSTK